MPTLAAGNKRHRASGFTLLELLVVIALIGIATAGVSLSLRDSGDSALERDADRLAVLLETARAQARASGLAVVSYDCAAALELIESGDNGVLVPTGDDVSFVNAAVQLAVDPERIARFRAAAAKAVADRSWDAVADTFLHTLRAVLERHGRPFASVPASRASASGLPAKERLAHSHARPLL